MAAAATAGTLQGAAAATAGTLQGAAATAEAAAAMVTAEAAAVVAATAEAGVAVATAAVAAAGAEAGARGRAATRGPHQNTAVVIARVIDCPPRYNDLPPVGPVTVDLVGRRLPGEQASTAYIVSIARRRQSTPHDHAMQGVLPGAPNAGCATRAARQCTWHAAAAAGPRGRCRARAGVFTRQQQAPSTCYAADRSASQQLARREVAATAAAAPAEGDGGRHQQCCVLPGGCYLLRVWAVIGAYALPGDLWRQPNGGLHAACRRTRRSVNVLWWCVQGPPGRARAAATHGGASTRLLAHMALPGWPVAPLRACARARLAPGRV
jgi:hypothetical protein